MSSTLLSLLQGLRQVSNSLLQSADACTTAATEKKATRLVMHMIRAINNSWSFHLWAQIEPVHHCSLYMHEDGFFICERDHV
jgi:hypothetical protein